MSSSSSVPFDGNAYIQAHSDFLQNTMYRIMGTACTNSLAYFHGEQIPVDSVVLPGLVRMWAKRYFQANGAYNVVDLPNNGLCIQLPDSILRIWKSADGKIANPCATKQKSTFLTQPTITQPELPFSDMPLLYLIPRNLESPLRLAVLWNLNPDSEEIELHLACPKRIIYGSDEVEFHWKLPIPRSAASKQSAKRELKPTRTNDLDIELESDNTGTEDND